MPNFFSPTGDKEIARNTGNSDSKRNLKKQGKL